MDPDQPAHPRSLIRIHAVRYQLLYLFIGFVSVKKMLKIMLKKIILDPKIFYLPIQPSFAGVAIQETQMILKLALSENFSFC
jgi:hypothetical protein